MDGDLDPMIGVEWVGLVCAWGTNRACILGYQLGYIGSRIVISVRRYDLAMVKHHSKNWKMKDGKMILIAYHLLESSIGTYIEWLANELMLIANKIKDKDALLVMLLQMQ